MVNQISTSDSWEAAYMLLNNASLDEIEGMQTNGKIICRMILSGENVVDKSPRRDLDLLDLLQNLFGDHFFFVLCSPETQGTST